MPTPAPSVPRLTSLTHGGGCGCKIAPAVLAQLLHAVPTKAIAPLLVGTETGDDAAVYQLNDSQAIIATTDFFMPIVDDPFDFGRIAAANALSDVYAMGGQPILALAIVGMPVNVLPVSVIGDILRGGESICREAGITVAGGHSIDSAEPIYGLAVLGVVHPQRLKRNCDARAGDVLVLGKPLGVGVLSAALKRGRLEPRAYRTLVEVTTQLNRAGAALAAITGVHAMTDVTGFGLLGHLLGICRGSGVAAELAMANIPLLDEVLGLAAEGVVTGASGRNWAAYGQKVRLAPELTAAQQALLCDPQTSGGLLVSCAREALTEVMQTFARHGAARAVRIGAVVAGEPGVSVTP